MSIPATPLAPGAEGYEAIYEAWDRLGRPGMIENLAEGWLYRAYFPEPGWNAGREQPGSEKPTFVLACSTPNLGVVLGTYQNSWQGRRALPVEDV